MRDFTWPRVCTRCGHLHAGPRYTKSSLAGFFCTWCSDLAPPLVADPWDAFLQLWAWIGGVRRETCKPGPGFVYGGSG